MSDSIMRRWLLVVILPRAAAKEEAASEEGKKKKGGVSVPDEWPWEAAKQLFEKPDVLPADEVEVCKTVISSTRTQTD